VGGVPAGGVAALGCVSGVAGQGRAVVAVAGGVLGRRRRANTPGGRRVAHQVKVTVAEEAVLVRLAEAAGVSVPRLLVEAATTAGSGVTSTQRRDAVVELMTVSRVLAGVAGNLNQLARAVNAGAEFPPAAVAVREKIRELIPRIARACADLSDPGNRAPLRPPPGRAGGGGLGAYRGPEASAEASSGVGL